VFPAAAFLIPLLRTDAHPKFSHPKFLQLYIRSLFSSEPLGAAFAVADEAIRWVKKSSLQMLERIIL
jgi:hypothetical protein